MFELGLKPGNALSQQSMVRRSYELGWNTIAWNVTVTGKIGAAQCRLPVDAALPDVSLSTALLENRIMHSSQGSRQLRQLKRITIIVDDVNEGGNSLGVGNTMLKEFDIVAAIPGNSKSFAYLCKFADVDLISLSLGSKLQFPLNKKLVKSVLYLLANWLDEV